MRGHVLVLAVASVCAFPAAACGSEDAAQASDPSTTQPPPATSATTEDPPEAGPTSATVVSVEVGDEMREIPDTPESLPSTPDGAPAGLAEMNESAELEVVGPRTVEVRFTENLCRAVARDVEVVRDGGPTKLVVRVGTVPECVPDPESQVPAMEGAVEAFYAVRVELDSDLPAGGAPVVELVA